MNKLFYPIHPNARPMNGLVSRIAGALARPRQTSYVAPTVRTIEALAYAIRGYEVYWTPVSFDEEDPGRIPSSVCYRIFKRTPATHNERVPSHGVELSSVLPDWTHKTEMCVRHWSALARARLAVHQRQPSP